MAEEVNQSGSVYTRFCSASIRWGASGYGKSTELHATGEDAFENGYKVICLNDDEGRFEYGFYAFKGRESLYHHFCKTQLEWGNVKKEDWEKIDAGEKFFSDVFPWEPKAYPIEIYIPATPQIPRQLPSCFKPFRIAFSKLKCGEMKLLLGKLTKKQSRTIDILWEKNKEKTIEGFIQLVKDYAVDRKVEINEIETNLCEADEGVDLISKLDKIHRLGILSTKDDPLDLNIDRIMWDRKTITAFSFFNIEDGVIRYAFYAFLLRRIRRLRTKKLSSLAENFYPELHLLIHELQEMAPAQNYEDPDSAEGQKICRVQLARLMKQPRDIFVRVHADSQDPSSVYGQVRAGFKTTFIFYSERKVLDNIRELVYFSDAIYIGLQRSQIGIHCIKSHPTGGKDYTGANYPVMSLPPKSMVKSPDDRFFRTWKEQGGEFKTWEFTAPEKITEFKKRKKEKLQDVPNAKERRIYDFLGAFILQALDQTPGQTPKDLLDHPILSSPHVKKLLTVEVISLVIKHLEAQGEIIRRPDPKDNRALRSFRVEKPPEPLNADLPATT